MHCSQLALLLTTLTTIAAGAQEPQSEAPTRPLHALLVTGGCCHDYDRQKLILTRGISARADVRWTVVQQGGKTTDTPIPLYNDPDWAKGFDIVIHNECFAHVRDVDFVNRILKPHQNGTPAILIHCAMHCYRTGDDRWFEFVGLQSPGHGPHYAYSAENVKPDHPIMRGFGEAFEAPKGELYHSVKVFDTATPLAQANRRSDGLPQVCVWTNNYRGTRVFGTTIGHYNETMAEPKYLDMLTRGLLWACGRDPEKHFRPATPKATEAIAALVNAPVTKQPAKRLPGNCCGAGNLAYKRPVTSKTVQNGNDRAHLTDGRLDTRWCASSSAVNEWVTVDLEEPADIRNIRLHWEKRDGIRYRYLVEASADNKAWQTIVDASKPGKVKAPMGIRAHEVKADKTRYLRVTFLGADRGLWGSLWELEATTGTLPELDSLVTPEDASAPGVADVQTPDGYQVTLFGRPPAVNYPVCITAATTGEVFVGVDEQGSLGKEAGRGKVLRCIDTDGDGSADQINEFAKMDHPRGLIYDAGSLWVLHPPFLSVFRDTDGDGTSDEQKILVRGISTSDVNKRGADHTTNGITMGIDGWIYIAVGDFGFHKAVGADGTTLSKRGGGVVRVRPDGTEMEVYAWGQRNIVDVAVDPYMNLFTRDNTNDGGGWDIRLSHVVQSANYGYPSLYKNFTAESMPPLADYGGGSGCGAMYFHDERWPAGMNNLLLTCDWGRSIVFSHDMPPEGATFRAQQGEFVKLPRPTDIDVDGSGRMYISSWKNGKFNYDGPNIGFVAQVTPIDFVPKPVPELRGMDDGEVVQVLTHPSANVRLHAQRELVRRSDESYAAMLRLMDDVISGKVKAESGADVQIAVAKAGNGTDGGRSKYAGPALRQLARDRTQPLYARVAAIYTLRQIDGAATETLISLAGAADVREHCIRALTDRKTQITGKEFPLLLEALHDSNPRVQAAAVIGMPRLLDAVINRNAGDEEPPLTAIHQRMAADAILPLTKIAETEFGPAAHDWRVPKPERVLPHLAVQALVSLNAVEACVDALSSELAGVELRAPWREGALWALKSMHSKAAVDGLFNTLAGSRDDAFRREIWTTLIRLYHREGDFVEGKSPGWWGTRPDTTGPYYHRVTWSQSERIAAAIRVALAEADKPLRTHLQEQLRRHVVKLDGQPTEVAAMEPQKAIELPKPDPDNPNIIANLELNTVVARALKAKGDAATGQKLFVAQSCNACHTFANGQQPKGPHLVDIGRRYKPKELIDSILRPSNKIAQGFDTWTFLLENGETHTGFVVLESAETITIRLTNGLTKEFPSDDVDDRHKQNESMMPEGIVDNLTPEQLADLLAYLQSLQ